MPRKSKRASFRGEVIDISKLQHDILGGTAQTINTANSPNVIVGRFVEADGLTERWGNIVKSHNLDYTPNPLPVVAYLTGTAVLQLAQDRGAVLFNPIPGQAYTAWPLKEAMPGVDELVDDASVGLPGIFVPNVFCKTGSPNSSLAVKALGPFQQKLRIQQKQLNNLVRGSIYQENLAVFWPEVVIGEVPGRSEFAGDPLSLVRREITQTLNNRFAEALGPLCVIARSGEAG